MISDRRIDYTLRGLVIIGNNLAMWAGRPPTTPEEHVELDQAHRNWDNALKLLRTQRKEVEHISL